jgi:hypothetical protein
MSTVVGQMDQETINARAAYAAGAARSPWTFLLLLPSALLCGLSWLAGGIAMLTDLGFLSLTFICGVLFTLEMVRFPKRFGIGGMVLYGGVLLWFSYDYMTNWMGARFTAGNIAFNAVTVAKAAWFHCLFIMAMVVGLRIPLGRTLLNIVKRLPEPTTYDFYLWLVLLSWCVGVLPYVFFAEESFFRAIWLAMTSMRSGGVTWTVGRAGNVTTTWGSYVTVPFMLGNVGGQLAAFYAILFAHGWRRIVAWAIWGFWFAIAFGTGTRGEVAFMGLPVILLVFLKYQSVAAAMYSRVSKRAFVVTGIIAAFVLLTVQFQSYVRTTAVGDRHVTARDLVALQGNAMFTEGLLGFELIPRRADFFYNRFPGEQILAPIPVVTYYFLIGPVPRMLWHNKPIDPAWEWYNAVYLGKTSGEEGTTIAQGLVGFWYLRFGFMGVLQGGLLFGWLLAMAERLLREAERRPLRLLVALGIAAWLFRCYRGMNFHNLYPLLIAVAAVAIAIAVQRVMSPQRSAT